jgi:hypothetical protein
MIFLIDDIGEPKSDHVFGRPLVLEPSLDQDPHQTLPTEWHQLLMGRKPELDIDRARFGQPNLPMLNSAIGANSDFFPVVHLPQRVAIHGSSPINLQPYRMEEAPTTRKRRRANVQQMSADA